MQSQTSIAEIHSENYRFLQEHIYSQAGIVLEEDKHYLFESRLTPIVRQLGLDSINDLCALLRATRETEVNRQVVEAMTTNETYFFRDPAHYEAIRTVLLPRLKENRQDAKKLRFWSAAASTGQEAYSLAMLLIRRVLPTGIYRSWAPIFPRRRWNGRARANINRLKSIAACRPHCWSSIFAAVAWIGS